MYHGCEQCREPFHKQAMEEWRVTRPEAKMARFAERFARKATKTDGSSHEIELGRPDVSAFSPDAALRLDRASERDGPADTRRRSLQPP